MLKALLLSIIILVTSIKGIDNNKIRYGSISSYVKGQTVTVIDSQKVYLQTAPYKTIIKDKVQKGSARYVQLMEEATTLYKNALAKAGHKLIIESSGVDDSLHKTTDITQEVINLL